MARQPEDPTPTPSTDSTLIRELATLLDETNLTEIEIEQGELRIRVSREIHAAPVHYQAAAPAPARSRHPPGSPRPRRC